MNDFHEVRSSLLDLLVIFRACGSQIYFKNVGVALAQFDYLEKIGHPVYDLLCADISAFVEEPGEIAFGMLGTLEARSGKQPNNYDHVKASFLLLQPYMDTYSKLSGESKATPSKYQDYPDHAMETVMLHGWMVGLVDACQDGSFIPYDLKKFSSSNVPKLSDVSYNDPDFPLRIIADVSYPPTIFNQVEGVINDMYRLWHSKRSRDDSD